MKRVREIHPKPMGYNCPPDHPFIPDDDIVMSDKPGHEAVHNVCSQCISAAQDPFCLQQHRNAYKQFSCVQARTYSTYVVAAFINQETQQDVRINGA